MSLSLCPVRLLDSMSTVVLDVGRDILLHVHTFVRHLGLVCR